MHVLVNTIDTRESKSHIAIERKNEERKLRYQNKLCKKKQKKNERLKYLYH